MIPRTAAEIIADLYHRLERVEGRIENRERTGLVTDVDNKKGLVRVALGVDPVTGETMKSAWLNPDEPSMGTLKHHTPRAVGEQMTVQSESGEFHDARARNGTPSDQNKRPNGDPEKHARTIGNLKITEGDGLFRIECGSAVLEVTPGKITIKCGEVAVEGHVAVKGNMDQVGMHVDSIGPHA